MTTTKHVVLAQNAAQIKYWILNRGGILIWNSIDLSDLGKSWTTPATYANGATWSRPSWQASNTPSQKITSLDEVEVQVPKEIKRFHVALRMGSQGLMLKCTDGSTRRIRKAVEKAGPDAWYAFDYSTQEAVIYVPDKKVPLEEWDTEGIQIIGAHKE